MLFVIENTCIRMHTWRRKEETREATSTGCHCTVIPSPQPSSLSGSVHMHTPSMFQEGEDRDSNPRSAMWLPTLQFSLLTTALTARLGLKLIVLTDVCVSLKNLKGQASSVAEPRWLKRSQTPFGNLGLKPARSDWNIPSTRKNAQDPLED